jgi:membrane-bound lytic murein transglycosylase D
LHHRGQSHAPHLELHCLEEFVPRSDRPRFLMVLAGVAMMVAACGRAGLQPVAPAPVPAAVPDVPIAEPEPIVTPAAEVLKESATVDSSTLEPAPVPEDVVAASPEEAPVSWDIEVAPYESHARVEYFVGRFTGGARTTFELSLERQSRYAPLIHERLRAAGLPQDMIYLPLIESWYDPHAYSRAAAVGMWQFMTGTARAVGMRVDWWVDDRRDPVRSTEGAMIFLKELKSNFGSMYLAAAAYNGGPGRISRSLTAYASEVEGAEGDAQFFALAEAKALRQETSDYVPKLIAAALVGKDASRYGIERRQVLPFTWDSVLVPAAVPLAAVAKAIDIPLDSMLEYNHGILRGMTPPKGDPVWLRVPVGTAEGFPDRFGKLTKAERTAVKRYVTKDGDYITKIARANGLTAKQLNWYNPGATRLKNGNLHTGQVILVPTRATVAAARDVPNPAIERYGSSTTRVHVVKRGESLSVIARKNGLTLARLKSLNGLKGDQIRIGQKLRVR